MLDINAIRFGRMDFFVSVSFPSSGGSNKLGIVYLNDKVFTNLETVVFKESNITTNLDGINTTDTAARYQNISKSFIYYCCY